MIPVSNVEGNSLVSYLIEKLIDAGIPAVFWIIIIFFAAKSFRDGRKFDEERERQNLAIGGESAVAELYDDLYTDGDSSQQSSSPMELFRRLREKQQNQNKRIGSKRNLGIPSEQFIKVKRINDKFNSFDYSLTSALKSKAYAAAQLRSKNFDMALRRATDSSLLPFTRAEKTDLLKEESDFLRRGAPIVDDIASIQRLLTETVIRDEMSKMDISLGEIDPYPKTNSSSEMNVTNHTTSSPLAKAITSNSTTTTKAKSKSKEKEKALVKDNMKQLEKLNTELMEVELSFIRSVIEIMGPDRANGIRAAILGNLEGAAGAAAGSLLRSLQERPLSVLLSSIGYTDENEQQQNQKKKSLFVTEFNGDGSASQVEFFREEVTAILRASSSSSNNDDEALVILQSPGGTVTGYGLAAAQLKRFKDHGMKLTICVEQVAASGGYMMCCIGDRIIASPFAVLGSIGVISELPNVYERLKTEGIEFQTVTAGKYKRTLTPTKKVTKEDFEKSKQDLEQVYNLFKDFVKDNRPSLDIESVATGEVWFGKDALDRGLCDEIKTADDVLMEFVDAGYDVYDVRYEDPAAAAFVGNLLPLPLGNQQQQQRGRGGGRQRQNNNNDRDMSIGRLIIQWLVRSIVPVIKEEVMKEIGPLDSGNGGTITDQYVAKDPMDASNRFQMRD